MTNERLHELVDLVTEANYFFDENGIGCDCLLTINRWSVSISVFESVNPYENATHYRDDDNDHDFIMAEKHIKRLMGENDGKSTR